MAYLLSMTAKEENIQDIQDIQQSRKKKNTDAAETCVSVGTALVPASTLDSDSSFFTDFFQKVAFFG